MIGDKSPSVDDSDARIRRTRFVNLFQDSFRESLKPLSGRACAASGRRSRITTFSNSEVDWDLSQQRHTKLSSCLLTATTTEYGNDGAVR
jgi:hypothetical protein